MVEFIKTRSPRQWLAATAWGVLIAVVAIADMKAGKTGIAVAEAIIYPSLFVAAATLGHFNSK